MACRLGEQITTLIWENGTVQTPARSNASKGVGRALSALVIQNFRHQSFRKTGKMIAPNDIPIRPKSYRTSVSFASSPSRAARTASPSSRCLRTPSSPGERTKPGARVLKNNLRFGAPSNLELLDHPFVFHRHTIDILQGVKLPHCAIGRQLAKCC